MNTLMTGTRGGRGQYSAAGYMHAQTEKQKQEQEQGDLYIASVPAGSAQEELRDFNRAGYQAERPWRQTPEPLFEQGAAPEAPDGPVVRRSTPKGRAASMAAQRRRDIIACIVLGCAVLMIVAMWGQKMVQGVSIQRDIEMYRRKTVELEQENEKLIQQLELARDGERIRNLAQNRLGMLRPERAQSQTIYIQNAAEGQRRQEQEQEAPRLGFLDLMLGLLDMLNIGE